MVETSSNAAIAMNKLLFERRIMQWEKEIIRCREAIRERRPRKHSDHKGRRPPRDDILNGMFIAKPQSIPPYQRGIQGVVKNLPKKILYRNALIMHFCRE